jgi:hypothetical protein
MHQQYAHQLIKVSTFPEPPFSGAFDQKRLMK